MDGYLEISAVANDEFMQERMKACATQQAHLGNAPAIVQVPNEPVTVAAVSWVMNNNYLWASSPSWGEKWASAVAGGNEEPGKDPAVITDADILATVQALTEVPSDTPSVEE